MELCQSCGKAACSCTAPAPSSGLELDLDIRRPPPAARAANVAPIAPPSKRAPLPPPPSAGPALPTGFLKLLGWLCTALGVGFAVWFGVQKLKKSTEEAMDDTYVRPYAAPNRLVIAAVTKDYGSLALEDGSVVLKRMPKGSSMGLAGWYGGRGAPEVGTSAFIDEAIASLKQASYRPLEPDPEKCRKDGETVSATLGEVSFGDDGNVTLWTCTLTKKTHTYFLAWAALSSEVEQDKRGLMYMVKGAQLVNDTMCSMNVINGGCRPSTTALISTLIANARR